MSGLTAWRAALVAALTGPLDPIRIYTAQPERVAAPCVFIEPDIPYVELDDTTTEAEQRVNFLLTVVLNANGTIEARLAELEGIFAVIQTALAASAAPARWDQFRQLGVLTLGESTYVAATVACHAYTGRGA